MHLVKEKVVILKEDNTGKFGIKMCKLKHSKHTEKNNIVNTNSNTANTHREEQHSEYNSKHTQKNNIMNTTANKHRRTT